MSVGVKVEIKDFSKEVLKALENNCEEALKAVGEQAISYAKKDCPVNTGRLKNSITYAYHGYRGQVLYTDDAGKPYSDGGAKASPEKNALYIGTNVEYAAKQEYGEYKHKVGKKHFLKDAATNHIDHYKKIIEAALKGKNG